MYHSSSRVFMMNNTPSGMKKHHDKVLNHKVARQPVSFLSFFFFFSSFFFRRASSKLRDSFKVVFALNSSILH